MKAIFYAGAVFVLTAALFIPSAMPVSAQVPIGGLVTAVAPCPTGAGYLYTVVGLGIGTGVFWYFPGVPTFLYGPPIIGDYVLGLAAPTPTCGFVTEFVGTSLPLGAGASTGAGAALNGHGLY